VSNVHVGKVCVNYIRTLIKRPPSGKWTVAALKAGWPLKRDRKNRKVNIGSIVSV